MLAIIFAAWRLTQGPHDAWQARFFLPGLALCLVGDVFLMLPGNSFLAGLVAFLLAHVCYTVGLTPTLPPPATLAIAAIVALTGLTAYRRIADGLRHKRQASLLYPVAAYIIVIGLMLTTAWATILRPEWTALRRALLIGGASLFVASDAMLAWNRFVAPLPSGPVMVRVTYHLGQMALAASIALTA
jgi:uncharacterized membrane protein YhhN